MRHLVRRFHDRERGAGVIEYALLTSGLGLALVGMLTFFGRATGDVTQRAAASVSAQATREYGAPGTVGEGATEETAQGPATEEPDSISTEPDSSAASSGSATTSPDPADP